jgi:N-ethylmaleimide reductase
MSVTAAAPVRADRHVDASADTIFSPYRLGDLALANRMVMAPMTRSRAVEGNVPSPLAPP